MKKALSLTLICLLILGTLAMGGCGKTIRGKEAFTDADEYYFDLIEAFASPFADIDSDKLDKEAAATPASSMETSLRLKLEGLDSLSELIGMNLGESVELGGSAATDGEKFSASLGLTLFSDMLNLNLYFDGANLAASIPAISDQPFVFNKDTELPNLIGEIAGSEDNGEADTTMDSKTVFAFASLLNPTGLDFIKKYCKEYVNALPDSCFSNGEDTFRTADKEDATLDCVEISADASLLIDALTTTAAKLAVDSEPDTLLGENAAAFREAVSTKVSEIVNDPSKLGITAFRHTRFFDGDDIVGDRIYIATAEKEMQFEIGLSDGKDNDLAFFTYTDITDDRTVISADTVIGDDTSTLNAVISYGSSKFGIIVEGTKSDAEDAEVTTSAVKLNAENATVQVMTITSTVHDCDLGQYDTDVSIAVDVPAILTGNAIKFNATLELNSKCGGDVTVTPIDMTNPVDNALLQDDTFKLGLLEKLYQSCPHIFEQIINSINSTLSEGAE